MLSSVVPKLPFIDKKQTLDFYTNQLGFILDADYGDYLILHREGVELHFFSYPSLEPSKSDFMIYVRVDKEIEELYHGFLEVNPPIDRLEKMEVKPWGQKEFAIIDPNGTLLTFGQSLK